MRNEPLDFIGVDYAVDNREVETTHPPAGAGAEDRRAGVRAVRPHAPLAPRRRDARCRRGRSEFDATTWAQFFLKFVVSHPAVTAMTPATSQAKNMIDNLGGGSGPPA